MPTGLDVREFVRAHRVDLVCSAESRGAVSFAHKKRPGPEELESLPREKRADQPQGQRAFASRALTAQDRINELHAGICSQAYKKPDAAVVEVAKYAKCAQAKRGEAKRRRVLNGFVKAEAWNAAAAQLPHSIADSLEFGHTGPAIPAHHTHVIVMCGGFVGCMACGTVTGWAPSKMLSNECRRSCPPGSCFRVQRLVRGQLPHPQSGHQGRTWPDGSIEPVPYKWRAPQPAQG